MNGTILTLLIEEEDPDDDDSDDEYDEDDDVPLEEAYGQRGGRSKRRQGQHAPNQNREVQSDSGVEDDVEEEEEVVVEEAKVEEVANDDAHFDFQVDRTPAGATPAHMRQKPAPLPSVRMQDPSPAQCMHDVGVSLRPVAPYCRPDQYPRCPLGGPGVDSRRLRKKKTFRPTDVTHVTEIKKLHGLLISMTMQKFRNINNYILEGRQDRAIRFPNFGAFMSK